MFIIQIPCPIKLSSSVFVYFAFFFYFNLKFLNKDVRWHYYRCTCLWCFLLFFNQFCHFIFAEFFYTLNSYFLVFLIYSTWHLTLNIFKRLFTPTHFREERESAGFLLLFFSLLLFLFIFFNWINFHRDYVVHFSLMNYKQHLLVAWYFLHV